LKSRSAAEQLSQEEIVQLLRERKAKKDLQRAQNSNPVVQNRQKEQQRDMMDVAPQQPIPEKPTEPEAALVPPPPENLFKSEILQRI
jgi:hypothetical protein